jgi:hypothetical protein
VRGCAACGQTLPPEHERSFITRGTPFCQGHARARILGVYWNVPEARIWLGVWEVRFRQAVEAADIIPDEILTGTSRLE